MVAVPVATGVTKPLALTVATAVLDDVHAPPVVTDVNCVVAPFLTVVVPVIAATVGKALTFTNTVELPTHPYEFITLAV